MLTLIAFLLGGHVVAAPVQESGLGGDHDRTWQTAVQNINGMNSILTLLPVLTGKTQNMKLLASRIFPASFVVAGIGAGRVLLKFQLGILLWSFDLYRNTIGDLSYPHDEYVNKFAPRLLHVPTGTPERHRTKEIINHNVSENYMVEAWFRTQGSPARVRLKQTNNIRTAIGFAVYVAFYAVETFLAAQNAAEGAANALIAVQVVCICLWLVAVAIVQIKRGQGSREVELNQLSSPTYRCLALPMSGGNVESEIFSFSLTHLNNYKLYDGNYSQPLLAFAGALILISGILDILSTVLIVGLSTWAYPWIGFEIGAIFAKVLCCVEPLREIELEAPSLDSSFTASQAGSFRLPLKVNLEEGLICHAVCTDHNIFTESSTKMEWRSTSAGLWIGQEYWAGVAAIDKHLPRARYLAYIRDGQKTALGLAEIPPEEEGNQALQREFLAALGVLVESSKVPSKEFLDALKHIIVGIQGTMSPEWFEFGTKDVRERLHKAYRASYWRRYL